MVQMRSVSPFLRKTYELVDDGSSDDVVSWNESGTTFVVWKTAEFSKDVLPNYFKHNNFSSFVRQLNTYGFRKVVHDKWEFANEYFRKGQRELICRIRRRKTAPSSPAREPSTVKTAGGPPPSLSNSGVDLGSTSTSSSPETKSPIRSTKTASQPQLEGDNEKLKRDNEILSSELAQTKKQCEELVGFLMEYVNVGPDQIDRILKGGISCGSSLTGSVPETILTDYDNDEDDDDDGDEDGLVEEEEERVKLFGVWLKGEKKREREEKIGCGEPNLKEMKKMAPWMMMSPPVQISKACN